MYHHYPSNANAFYGYPSAHTTSFSAYPQHPHTTTTYVPAAPQPVNPRERYLAAIAEARAAEAEYLGAQAKAQAARQEEEAMLRRRLAELQRQREEDLLLRSRPNPGNAVGRHPGGVATPSYHHPQFGYPAPVVTVEPARELVSPEVMLCQPQACQPVYAPARHARAQAAPEPVNVGALEQFIHALQPQSQAQPRRRHGSRFERVHHHQQQPSQPAHSLEDFLAALAPIARPQQEPVQTVSTRVAPTQPTLNDFLSSLFNPAGPQPVLTPAAPQPSRRAHKVEQQQAVEASNAEALIKAFYDNLLKEVNQVESAPSTSAAPRAPQPEVKKTQATEVAPVGSSENPLVVNSLEQLGQILNAVMHGQLPQEFKGEPTKNAAASSSSSKVRPQSVQTTSEPVKGPSAPVNVRQPSTTESTLKQQLEARLNDEYASEVRDTIQAILLSLTDHSSPPATASRSSSPDGSVKGKGKAAEDTPKSITSRDVLEALKSVNNLDKAFRAVEGDFAFPAELDFVEDASTSQSATSALSFASRNQPVRFYEQALGALLGQLDAIESFGNDELRSRRKEVVDRVEKALEDLERDVAGRYKAHRARELKKRDASAPSTPVEAFSEAAETVEEVFVDASAEVASLPKSPKSSPIVEEEDESETASSVGSNDDLKPYEVVLDDTAVSPAPSSPSLSAVEVVEEPQNLELGPEVIEGTFAPVSEAPIVDETIAQPEAIPVQEPEFIVEETPSESAESVVTIRPSSPSPTSSNEPESEGFLIDEGARTTEETNAKGRPAYKDHDDASSDWSEIDG
ncbi:hypothetical protein BDN72DRAFT_953252 [Pluteus cervinus]|uniref:Uncharacterized protein n=1 Tax=Pluteus cervinus TaxID=181527 RepID=A0ACD3BEU8_9AGAR|nr:hypothetical protein BDN72DRAFT_953252 [Pluteus cervinus]